MLKVLELFSGIGCQTQALKNIGIEHQSTQCDIDKYAVEIYNQLHGDTENLGDITKVDENTLSEGQWDLITYSFPCTSVSIAGQQAGADKNSGTASSLLWECERIIRKVKPKYLLMENVKNLLSKKHIHNFEEWLKILEDMGYKNYYKVLNAKDFGVPQNRERVFCVSILGEHEPYVFPEPRPLTIRLKDVLESDVDEKYYLSEKIQQRFEMKPQGDNIIGTTAPESRSIGQRDVVYNPEKTMGALVATDYKQPKQIIEFDMPNSKKAEITEDIIEPTKTLEFKKGTIAFIPNEDNSYTKYVFEKDVIINLEEPKLKYLGGIGKTTCLNDSKRVSSNYKEGYRVYDSDGISTTLKANGGGLGGCTGLYTTLEPVIIASRGRYTVEDDETKTEQHLEVNDSGLCNTLTTVQKDNYVGEPKIKVVGNVDIGLESTGRIYSPDGLCPTIDCMGGGNRQPKILDNNTEIAYNYKIRKLTPRECYRLMGWKDEEFDKITGISATQLYKTAGNGIVVTVLEAIFEKMFK